MLNSAEDRGGAIDSLEPGSQVAAYVVQAPVGPCPDGVSYLARHRDLQVPVSLEEYFPEGACLRDGIEVRPRNPRMESAYESGMKRFLNRARRLAGLRVSAGVVACLDYFTANGTAYLVREQVDGQILGDLLARVEGRKRPLDKASLASIAVSLVKGLAELHAAGIAHCGIDPNSVLVRNDDGKSMIVGAGRTKREFDLEHAVADGYAAIELVGDGEIGAWTDVYSVGAVMWRIVAGSNPPWEPPEPVSVEKRMHALFRGQPDPLPRANEIGAGSFPDRTLEVIDHCLRMPESERPQDCAQLLEMMAEDAGTATTALLASADEAPVLRPEEQVKGSLGVRLAGLPRALRLSAMLAAGLGAFGLGMLLTYAVPAALAPEDPPLRMSGFELELEPPDATVSLTGVGADYIPGMALPEGPYEAEVAADGYEARVVSIQHAPDRPKDPIILQASVVPAEEEPAGLTIDVVPATATIRLVGIEESYRPGVQLPEGQYQAEISADGYERLLLSVQHGAEPTNERVELRRIAAQRSSAPFTVEVLPPNALVRVLNIEERYRDGMALPVGQYRMEVSADRHATVTSTVMHGPGPTIHRVELKRVGDAFTVDSEPSGATVRFLDLDERYVPGMALPKGDYRVEVSAEAHSTVVRVISHGAEPTNEVVVLEPVAQVPSTLEFVWIPPGEFLLGATGPDSYADEQPQTRVRISQGFDLGKHEVTQAQWEQVMGSNPSHFRECGPSCPVENVSWINVQEFLGRLNAVAGGTLYRLPTEAEWEFAAEGGMGEASPEDIGPDAWWKGNSGGRPHPVGSKNPNGLGVHDMAGNVWEWVQDRYGEYPGGTVTDPSGPPSGNTRVVRGGGWNDERPLCRSASRNSMRMSALGRQVGFRLVRVGP